MTTSFTLPNRFISHLIITCAGAFALYVALMITAIYFASSTTELSALKREKEADVVALETEYYAAIKDLTKTDPATLGYVLPAEVKYVAAIGFPAFSLAE